MGLPQFTDGEPYSTPTEAIMATNTSTLAARLGAEAFGTFLLVLGGVGTTVFTAKFPNADTNSLGVGYLGVAIAFGLTVLVGVLRRRTHLGRTLQPGRHSGRGRGEADALASR
jgi:hypothetical protein